MLKGALHILERMYLYKDRKASRHSQWECECVVCGNHIIIDSYQFNKNIKLLEQGFNREGGVDDILEFTPEKEK